MTEEIIIDGVNVAGCEYYDDETCCNNYVFTLSCEMTNCMYKRLKRLEEERDFWQNKSCEFENFVDKQVKEIDELKQENKELQAYKDINEDFKKAWDKLNEKYKQLRSALEEINKIAEPRFVNGLNEEADLCNLAMDRIQNKINEVLQ